MIRCILKKNRSFPACYKFELHYQIKRSGDFITFKMQPVKSYERAVEIVRNYYNSIDTET